MINFDDFINKRVRVRQKDNFVKDGIFLGHDKDFIFLMYDSGERVAIAKDVILEIKVKEGRSYGKNRH